MNAIALVRVVMVDTNGALASPPNFFSKNSNALNGAVSFSLLTNGVLNAANGGTGVTNASGETNRLGLGAMALQPTNGPRQWAGTNYGPLTVSQSNPGAPSNDEQLNIGGYQLWDNRQHSVERELQLSGQGSMSWTLGLDGLGKAVAHFGGSGVYHSLWYMQYDDAGDTNHPGHSTPFGYVLHLNSGTAQTGVFSYFMGEQVDNGGTQDWRYNYHHSGGRPSVGAPGFNQTEFQLVDYIAGGFGSNTIFWAGGEFTNAVTRGNSTTTATATNAIDFAYNSKDFVTLNAFGSLALVETNLSFTNKTLNKRIVLHQMFVSPLTLTVPTNWLTVTPGTLSSNMPPTNVPAGNDLIINLTVDCSTTTNRFAVYSYAWNPVAIDTNAMNFFNAVGGGISSAESNAVNTFIIAAKSHGYWANLIDWHPLVGATSNSCSWNAVRTNKYRIAWHGTTSSNFTANGVYGDGSAMWADLTALDPSTELSSANSSLFGVWVRGPAQPSGGANVDFYGVVGNNNDRWGASVGSSTVMAQVGMNNNVQGGGSVNAGSFVGFLGQNRTGASVEQDYVSSTIGSAQTSTVAALPNGQDVGVWARQGGGADHFCNANLTSIVCGQNMTAQNMTDLIADLAAFNTALGR